MHPPDVDVVVVGIGADGWDGLGGTARRELDTADVVVGSARQLALVPHGGAQTRALPSPLHPGLSGLITELAGRRVVVLASGDPMWFGIGSTLVRLLGAARVRVVPHPSSLALAAARLGWSLEDVEVVSTVGRPLDHVRPLVQPGRRLLLLTTGRDAAARVRELLAELGYARSVVTVLSRLGGPDEVVHTGVVDEHDPLAVVAVECVPDVGVAPLSRHAVLPNEAFLSDGQLTKREIRALVLAALVPLPGQTLWDVGGGSGSIGIEWMRTHPACVAVAVEPRADRCARIAENARRLGVPGLQVVEGSAPEAVVGLPAPDAVFVGGGVTAPGSLDVCRGALTPFGRLVANAVTLESEAVLVAAHRRLGGTLTRLSVERAAPIGGFTGWEPARPVVQWTWRKEGA